MKDVVRAAGGVVARSVGDGALEVVIVHRVAYGDWTFPKGKTDENETDAEAALREVFEETSLECRLVRELGTTSYRDSRGRPKEVRYWEMAPVRGALEASNEIDAARWASVDEARSLLTYARDLAILDELGVE